ncbi:hypothetical protein ABZP36_006944 [Zizania latifolia]
MLERKSEEPTVAVKLFVDKERSKVLFAESGNEFVDVLFGFLTLPLGAVVRLFGKQSQLGCLDEVYKSVEDLSTDYFQTEEHKTMLLEPFIDDAAILCDKLKVKIDTDLRDVGQRPQCAVNTAAADSNGVFVEGCFKFIITDDLQIAPASTSLMLSLFEKFGVRDPAFLEQKILQLNAEKITSLLKRSLTTKQALTAFYFNAPCTNDDSYLYMLPENLHSEQEADVDNKQRNVKIKVLQTKNNLSLLYAEVGVDFIDLLFGLLCIPLGSIIRVYGDRSSNRCVDNICKSVVGGAKGCMNPQRQWFLQSPCVVRREYVKPGVQKFMVTDDLRVLPLSLTSTVQVVTESKYQSKDLVEKEFNMTKAQVMELLRAAVVTRNTLSSVLLPPREKSEMMIYD